MEVPKLSRVIRLPSASPAQQLCHHLGRLHSILDGLGSPHSLSKPQRQVFCFFVLLWEFRGGGWSGRVIKAVLRIRPRLASCFSIPALGLHVWATTLGLHIFPDCSHHCNSPLPISRLSWSSPKSYVHLQCPSLQQSASTHTETQCMYFLEKPQNCLLSTQHLPGPSCINS